MALSVSTDKLSWQGALLGGFIGFLLFTGAGYTGVAMIAAFFFLGTAATSWKTTFKERSGLAEANKGRRTAAQVIANAGVPAILAFVAWTYPSKAELCRIMMAAGFAAATADTLSSELGNVYGRRFYNILTFKKDTRGLNGVVSLEGSLSGMIGAAIIAGIYAIGFGWNTAFLWIIIAGTIGNITDSILGATVERKHFLNNNQVNFLNTLIAALAALLIYWIDSRF